MIHGNDIEYDYDFMSSRRKKIIEYISKIYKEKNKKELNFFELEVKTLKNVVTSKKEKKKDANFSRMPVNNATNINTFLYGSQTLSDDKDGNLKKRDARSSTIFTRNKDIKEVKIEEFQILKVLGRGSFGKVCLVEYKPTKELYAMKSLKKDVLIDQDQIENTLLEKKILQTMEHNFLVELIFCFQTEERVYFVMPFLRGGELFQHLRNSRIFDEERY